MKTIVISFDVEPDYPPYLGSSFTGIDEGLPLLLDLLKSERIPANIFFIAELCDRYPSLPKEIVRMGFNLGNHSMNHNLLCLEDFEAQLRMITVSAKLLEDASGDKLTTFRAPNFGFNEDTLRCLEKTGYQVDSSVLPGRRERRGLRSYAYDFRGATRVPYHPSIKDVRRPGASPVLEIPSTENPIVPENPIGGGFLNTYGAAKGLEAVTKAEGEVVVMVVRPWEFADIYQRYPSLPKWIKAACRKDVSQLSQFIGMAKNRGWKFITLEDVAESHRNAHPEIPTDETVRREAHVHVPQPQPGVFGRPDRESGTMAAPPIHSPHAKPRIMVMWPFFYPEINAAATRGIAFAKYLKKAGAEVEVIAPLRPNLPEDIWVGEVHVRRLTTYETTRLKHGAIWSRMHMSHTVSRIKDIIEQSEPSAILTSSPSPFFAFEVIKANKKLRVPLIFDVRDVWPYHVIASGGRITNTIKKHIERTCARGADLVFAVTDGVKQTLVKDHNLTPERVVVVPNGADLELFRPLSSEKKWDVVILGAASKYRNLENAYQAFALLSKRRPATKILHLGWKRGSYTIGLEKLAERLGLFPALELRPPVPLEQVPAILSAGRVGFVSQTFDAPIRAALAVKSFEYIAAGLPIACLGPPEDCELSKLVRETGAGIYASTPEELALEIQKLLDDSDRLEKLSTAAAHAAILFDRGAIVRRAYDQYFMPLMKGRRG